MFFEERNVKMIWNADNTEVWFSASDVGEEQKNLLRLKSMETIVDMHLETLMGENLPYKENLIQSI